MVVKDILESFNIKDFIGNKNSAINHVIGFNENNESDDVLTWLNDKNLYRLEKLKHGTVICSNADENVVNKNCNYIITDNPRRLFGDVLKKFFVKKVEPQICKSAVIAKNVKLGKNIFIGENVVIEEDCSIGDNTHIDHNTVIKARTIMGNNVIIGANCTIGGMGFGYEKDSTGQYTQIPHIGNVIIEDNVEIGNNCCVDRAVIGSTILRKNMKTDNFVHLAHGVDIGSNTLLTAHAMVAGSTTLGENIWVAPCVAISNKLKIGDSVFIGMSAAVLKNVEDNDIVAGVPARSIKKNT